MIKSAYSASLDAHNARALILPLQLIPLRLRSKFEAQAALHGRGYPIAAIHCTMMWMARYVHTLRQNGNGNKTLNMTVRTDGGEQSIIQKDSGAHTATIDLTGSYHTDLDLVQQGGTNQSYSLTQNCQTSGGCGVSVTQGN